MVKIEYLCTSMRKFCFISVFLLLSICAFSQRVERVKPQFCGNKAADQMIQYISDNLRVIIPAGKDLSKINAQMRCKITIDETGKIVDINITKHTVVWLELSIVDGLKDIRPSDQWSAEVAEQLQKELVFSFGNWRRINTEYGLDTDKISDNIQRQIDEERKAEADRNKKQDKAWAKVADEDLKVEMPLSPERGKNPNPEMKNQEILSPETEILQNIEISLE